MNEHLRSETYEETEPVQRQRLSYGAVPLDPWRARGEHTRNLYSTASIVRIERGLQHTMIDQDWFHRDTRAHALYGLMHESLLSSHFTRLARNGAFDTEQVMDADDSRVEYARRGLANPEELFTLLADYPTLGSLELAKLSHPFDFPAADEMDYVIEDLMLRVDGQLLNKEPRYKMKRLNADIPAGIMLRKQDLMDFPTKNGIIRIVQRRGFLVFDGTGIEVPYFDRLLKNPKNMPTLEAKIENFLEIHPKGLPYGWVQSQATSYYVKYVTKEATRPLEWCGSPDE